MYQELADLSLHCLIMSVCLKTLEGLQIRVCFGKLFSLFLNPYIIEPRHEISKNVVCATSKASDQPVHTHSLIRAFASHLNILRVLSY